MPASLRLGHEDDDLGIRSEIDGELTGGTAVEEFSGDRLIKEVVPDKNFSGSERISIQLSPSTRSHGHVQAPHYRCGHIQNGTSALQKI